MGQQIPASDLAVGDLYVTAAGVRSWSGEAKQVVTTKITVIGHRFIDIAYRCDLADRVVTGLSSIRADHIVMRLEETDPARVVEMVRDMGYADHLQVWTHGGKFYT